LFACARLSAIMVPSNPEFGVEEAGYVLRHAGVSGIVCSEEVFAVVQEACRGIDPRPWFLLIGAAREGAPDFVAEYARHPEITSLPQVSADDTCLIIYTSGTTGFPKGAMHSQRNFVTCGEAFVQRVRLQDDDRVMIVLPLFHINAL